ncbi:MAG: Allergen V5/Tpx family protein, partial [Candidatus Paceibacter sp.]|nr:Allergen V5/Tpx family protein [Candidatus Paceibacter sp.]
ANNGAGARVFQNYIENQNFGAAESKSFTSQWTPTQTGTYQIRMGVFGQSWSPQFAWVDNGSIVVGTTSGTTTPPATTTPPTATSTDESSCGRPGTNNFNVCYYQGQNREVFKLHRNDNQINFNWGQGSPDPAVPNDNFSARWLGLFDFENAEYEFTVTTDDGIRLNVDNQTILDKYFDQPETTYKVRKMMPAGQRGVIVEYYENWGDAVAKVSWQKLAGTSTPTTTPPTQGDNNVILNQTWQDTSSINQGQTNTFYVQVRSPNTNNTVLVDLELYNSNGQKVAQEFWDNIFVPKAGTGNFQDVYKLTSPSNLPAGNYYWSAGIFKPGWNGVLNWYHAAQAFTIGGSQPPQTSDVTLQNSTLGQAQGNACPALTAQLHNTSSVAKNVLVDFELRNSSGALVHQYFVDNYNVAGNATQNLSNVCNLTLPNGQYTYSVGIFNPSWQGLLNWYQGEKTFTK